MDTEAPDLEINPAPAASVGAGAPHILEYGQASPAGILTARIRPAHLTIVVASAVFLASCAIGRTPLWVAAAVALHAAALTYFCARIREGRPRGAPRMLVVQLFIAAAIAMAGMFMMLTRAKLVSNSILWLPDNQTHPYKPAWALKPLWLTAVGAAWFIYLLLLLEWRARRAAAAACPLSGKPQ